MTADPPPLGLDDVSELLDRIGDLGQEPDIVLVGGQALAFWASVIGDREPAARAAVNATADIDFQATGRYVALVADRLGGEARLPTIDESTPNTGLVRFVDARGHPRTLDFIECPFGLTAEDVRDTALRVGFPGRPGRFWVMHPERCLRSRVANTGLPGKRGQLAFEQLRASIVVVRGFGLMRLDAGEDEKVVRGLNESVFRLAHCDRRALRLYAEHGIDVLDALIDDTRLHPVHVERRLPQMRQLVAERRASWVARVGRDGAQPADAERNDRATP